MKTILILVFSLILGAAALGGAPDRILQEANAAYDKDRHEEAIRLFSELLGRQPAPAAAEAADFRYKRAYALFRVKRLEEARTDLLDAMELGQETAEGLNLLALVYSEKGEPDLAVDYGQRAVELARKAASKSLGTYAENLLAYSRQQADGDPAFVRGHREWEEGRHAEALRTFNHVLSAYPTGAHELSCRLFRARARLALGQSAEALADLQRVLELGGEAAQVLQELGECHSALGNEVRAYESLQGAHRLTTELADKRKLRQRIDRSSHILSTQADLLHRQAQAALQAGDRATARRLYAEAMLLPGGRSIPFLNGLLAFTRAETQAFDSQLATLTRLARVGTHEQLLAECQRLHQQHPANRRLDGLRCRAFFERLGAQNIQAWSLLGKAQNVPHGEWKKAIKHLDQAIKLAPNSPDLHLARADFLTLLKDPTAQKDIELAVRLYGGETSSTHSRRGALLLRLGDKDGAFEQLQSAMDLNADGDNIWTSTTKEFHRAEKARRAPASPEAAAPAGDSRSARQRAFDLAQSTPGSEASDLYTGLGFTHAYTSGGDSPETKEAQGTRAFADFCWALVLDPLNSNAYLGRARRYHAEGELNAALADFRKARELGNGSGADGERMVTQENATRSINAWLSAGGNASASGGSANSPAGGQAQGSRYCMRCRASGQIYVYEDGTDAYNRRVRVEKKSTCPECLGRGVR